jgi:adenylyltransferase/sulfurtransferase
MKEITVQELKKLVDEKANFQLIDVREQHEFDEANLNGLLIPMGEVMDHLDEIAKDKQVVVHCRSGKRSATVINALESQHGFTNLYNLKGGILAYIDEIGL